MVNSVDPDQTAPIGAVCSGSTLFASILNLSVILGNYLQQTTSADDIFGCIFFLGALRVSMSILRRWFCCLIVAPIVLCVFCALTLFFCAVHSVVSSFAIISLGKRANYSNNAF